MITRFLVSILLSQLGSTIAARHRIVPTAFAQDSAVIVDTNQPPPPPLWRPMEPQRNMLPYYQPVQHIPAYKIFTKGTSQNSTTSPSTPATIFTQEEFPRDLLEKAQQKLGLKTLDEVPSITELAELLGTNSAAETISYIRQLTSTEQGVALIKAYIESSDYTDSVGSKENEIIVTKEDLAEENPSSKEIATTSKPGVWQRITSFLNIYGTQPQHQVAIEKTLESYNRTREPKPTLPNAYRNLKPIYVRSPLPYHYPIPLRPLPTFNRGGAAVNSTNNARSMFIPAKVQPPQSHSHLNSPKPLNPTYIQQLARIANVSPKKLELFLQTNPKLAELAAKMSRYPVTHESSALADRQLLAAVQKVMEQDEDLKKLLASSETLK